MDESPGVPELGLRALRDELSSSDPSERAAALSRARLEPGVEEVLIEALRDSDERVRRESVRTLARLGTAGGRLALIEVSSSDISPAVRAEAVAALGRILESLRPRPAPGGDPGEEG
ncbi:MAG: HEAT repeat domain-containing protein [Actinomycetota bacterium]